MRSSGGPGSRNWRTFAIGIGAAALLVVGTAVPASAAEVTIDNLTLTDALSLCEGEAIGQTFTATATGAITELTLVRGGPAATVTLNIFNGATTVGAPAATQEVPLPEAVGDAHQTVELDTPFPVTAGGMHAFQFEGIPACQNGEHIYGASGYDGGTLMYEDLALPDLDLAFQIVIETTMDTDHDGVPDALDRCENTTFSAGPALKPNNVWSTSAGGFVDRAGNVLFSMADTGGCSAEQVIAEAGLGTGHLKQGISIGAMRDWIAGLG